jgi:hypothetical protein
MCGMLPLKFYKRRFAARIKFDLPYNSSSAYAQADFKMGRW